VIIEIINIENIFKKNPTLIISIIFKRPELKTTAFGGVATGSINAHDEAIEAPTRKI
jgi:hypothetical protein